MSRALLEILEEREAEVVAILDPLYAEVRHWEAELGRTRKAKRTLAPIETGTAKTEGLGAKHESGK